MTGKDNATACNSSFTTTRSAGLPATTSLTRTWPRSDCPSKREQLWLHPHDDGTHTLACIPFRTYGLALGDRVRLSPDATTVVELLQRSGRRVFRVLLMPTPDPDQMHHTIALIKAEIENAGLLSEWSGDRHACVDIPEGATPGALFAVTQPAVDQARAYQKWADAKPFTT